MAASRKKLWTIPKHPGIFRAHTKACQGKQKDCRCPYVVIHRHHGKPKKETFPTLAEARRAKGRRDSGDTRPTDRVTLQDYFDGWIKSYAGRTSRGFQETSREEYRRVIESFVLGDDRPPGWYPRMRLVDVDPPLIRDLFVKMRDDERSTSEIKKTRAALSAMFATAKEDGKLAATIGNPVTGVRIPPGPDVDDPDEDVKVMTREELGLILAVFPEGSTRLFFELLAHSGLRISEAVGLNWEHIDLGAKPHIRVREQVYRGKRKKLKTATGKRNVPLSSGMAVKLLAHRATTYTGETAPVFPSPSGRRKADGVPYPISPSNFGRDVLRPAREAIGMDWVTFHSFRHTCASLLFDKGRNIKQVAEWLGHRDPKFTLDTYVDLLDDGVGDADFLDDEITVAGATGGNTGATQGPEKAENVASDEEAKSAA